jgi:hypothetical protein
MWVEVEVEAGGGLCAGGGQGQQVACSVACESLRELAVDGLAHGVQEGVDGVVGLGVVEVFGAGDDIEEAFVQA